MVRLYKVVIMKNLYKSLDLKVFDLRLWGLSVIAMALSGCTYNHSVSDNTSTALNTGASSQTISINPANQPTKNKRADIVEKSNQIQSYLAQQQFEKLIPYIHPTKGVQFSMYTYVQPKMDKVFSREQFATYLNQYRVTFTWGEKDGTGDLYITTLPDYLTTWVKAEDFNNSEVIYNEFQGSGNSLNNLEKVYPNNNFIEFYNPGMNTDYQGMDWRALRLVFEKYQEVYYLVAIINDQWTI